MQKNLNGNFSLILQGHLFNMNSLVCPKSYLDSIGFDFQYAHHITKVMAYETYCHAFSLRVSICPNSDEKFLSGLISYILAT